MSIELPGVGSKYEIETAQGDKVAIVFLESGEIHLYVLEKGCDSPCVVVLSESEARRLGSILSGTVFHIEKELVEIVFTALSDLRISVHTYVVNKAMAGKSIEELAIRKRTGVTVIAVSRKGKNVVNPPPSFRFEDGDVIVVIGEHDQISKFEREILGIR